MPPAAPPAGASNWVRFLRQYGPIPQSGMQFDEDIQKMSRRNRITPLRMPTPDLEAIIDALRSETPTSVIVTGTAGDGKTYHCRETWLALGGSPDDWERKEKIKRLRLAGSGRELWVIRDLSEFQPEDRDAVLPQISEDVRRGDSPRVYLIAANDGKLLEHLKHAPQGEAVQALHATVEDFLVEGAGPRDGVRLLMVNLSNRSAGRLLPEVIRAVAGHEGWLGCASCGLREGEGAPGGGCPIWENRRRLAGEADGGVLRHRLGELLELSERDDVHVPVRELLLLTANTILGHPNAEHGLMSCKDVPNILREGTQDRASVYRNVLGENLTVRRREKIAIFNALARFGIGGETNNWIDGVLVYGADDPELRPIFEQVVLADPCYGGSPAFLRSQRAYLEGGQEQERMAFLSLLRAQRQRLFFTLPETEPRTMRHWDLTVFQNAGRYLVLTRRLTDGERLPRSEVLPLVRGLNRIFTGLLVSNDDTLILASSGSYSQAKTSRLLEAQVQVNPQLGAEVGIRADEHGRPFLLVSLGALPGLAPVRLPLTLLRYEFLTRVAAGSLPSSFSLECYEDMLAFKANVMRAEEKRRGLEKAEQDGDFVLRFLNVGSDGRANAIPVEVSL